MTIKEFFTPREGTGETAKSASYSVLESVFYFLFKSPYVLWTISNEELKHIREKHELEIREIQGIVPFIVYLFRFVVTFLIHALIYLTVVLAPLAALLFGIADKSCGTAFMVLLGMYYAPIALRLILEGVRIVWNIFTKYIWSKLKPILKMCWDLCWDLLRSILRFIPTAIILILDKTLQFITVFFNFYKYLSSKCEFKAAKYEKRKEDLNK